MKKTKTNRTKYIALASMSFVLGAGALVQYVPTQNIYANTASVSDEVIKTDLITTAATNWSYLEDNTDPASGTDSLQSWTTATFDDSAWNHAVGSFGAKKGVLGDINGFTPTILLKQYYEAAVNTPTFFFRTNVNIANIDELDSIRGSLFHDDATAVYINGKLLTSVDMPVEAQTSNMYYAGAAKGAPNECKVDVRGAQIKEYFIEGDNTIAIEVHNDRNTSSDLYFEFRELSAYENEPVLDTTQKSIMLTVGNDQSSKNISWYANTTDAGAIQYTKRANVINNVFPAEYTNVNAVSATSNDAGFNANQATLSNLEENTQYAYRVLNGSTTSDIKYFDTKESSDAFNFILMGDPQIGSGGILNDTNNWKATLDTATKKFNPDFIMSVGDQVNNAASEEEYAGYVQSEFSAYANATSIGNHDTGSGAYGQHFNLPNESADYGATAAGSDYYYVYNNTLFMMINSNDRSTAEHKAFMEEAIKANPAVRWKSVAFHHSIFSTASHYSDSDIITRRNELPPVFEDLDIDVVLMGHDHVYTRTYMMNTLTPDTTNGVQEKVVNPEGILYLTANSASGSKYYDIKVPNAEFSAKMDQSKRKTLTNISVSNTSYTMTTYFADDLSVLDTFTIEKTSSDKLDTLLTTTLAQVKELTPSEYTKQSWSALEVAIDKAEEVSAHFNTSKKSKARATKISYTQTDIDNAISALEIAFNGLVKVTNTPGTKPNVPSTPNTGNSSSNNGAGNTTSHTSSTSPNTGDTTNTTALWVLLVSALGSIGVMYKKKQK